VKRTAKKTTTIHAFGDVWRVPRGFGRAYRTVVHEHVKWISDGKPGKVITDILAVIELIGYTATREQIADWNARRRVEACVYAATEYARASDNPVQRHPRPSWLIEEPWRGPERGKGVWRGPAPTSIGAAP
jgi:hypothetical protein